MKCLIWQGTKDSAGYGRVKWENKTRLAHRKMYEIWYNVTLSPDEVLLHECDNPSCINPFHLTRGSQLDNVRDMDEKGRRYIPDPVSACPRGHAYTPENTRIHKNGYRICRTCERERKR